MNNYIDLDQKFPNLFFKFRLEKLVPKRYAPTAKVPNTRGCYKCCYGRNAYNGFKYLCGALPNSIILMQWYDPLNKYMLLKVGREVFRRVTA